MLLLIMICVEPANAQSAQKKVIEYGWDTPTAQLLHDHLAEWQDRPFDGIIFSLADNGGLVFNLQSGDRAKLLPQIGLLRNLRWGRFTDNFLLLMSASNMDWTSDSDWSIVLAHVRLCALAAKTAGCKGVAFDPEPYGGNPWLYSAQSQSKNMTFAQYQQIVRRRGSEFMSALQSECPGLKILTFYQYSEFVDEFGDQPESSARDQLLELSPYGLFSSFLDGILAAAGPRVELIDGNERSYWYTSPDQFTASYGTMHGAAQDYVAPDLRTKYSRQFRAAQGMYTDYGFDLQHVRFPSAPGASMSTEQRDRLFESNLYYALKASDEYVWVYGEEMNWWTPQSSIPPGMADAIEHAEARVNLNESLGFSASSSVTAAKFRQLLLRFGL